ncbi:MAG: DUF898 family protein [Sneathiella sp.]
MQSFVAFDISKKAVVGRLLTNKFLGLLTFGLYRFWGKTYLRRLFWQSIKVAGERLQYHGTAGELFIGFLIAMVVLTIVLGGTGVLLAFLSTTGPVMEVIAQAMNFLLLYSFWQFARYRLWRFRASRTSLRTIRFFLTGSAFSYMARSIFWSMITILTLGWALPVLLAVRSRYVINNLGYGDQHFTYNGSTSGFFKIYWPAILLSQCIMGAIAFQVIYVGGINPVDMAGSEQDLLEVMSSPATMVVLYGGILLNSFFFLMARVKSFRYVIGETTFGTASFTSSLNVSRVLLILIFMMLVSVVGLALIFGLIFAAASGAVTEEMIALMAIGAFVVLYFIMDILFYMFMIIPLVRAVSESLQTDNAEIFEQVAASAEKSPKYGEGFADALDVGAF